MSKENTETKVTTYKLHFLMNISMKVNGTEWDIKKKIESKISNIPIKQECCPINDLFILEFNSLTKEKLLLEKGQFCRNVSFVQYAQVYILSRQFDNILSSIFSRI